jgi:hypothetical protein
VSLAVRGAGAGASCDDASEDVSVAFADHVARLDALDVAALLRRFALHKKVRSPHQRPCCLSRHARVASHQVATR